MRNHDLVKPIVRLKKSLNLEPVDRVPVILPSGLIMQASKEVLIKTDILSNDIHFKPVQIAEAARAMAVVTGFENLALPMTMTVESEAYGGECEVLTVNDGMEQKPFSPPLKSLEDFKNLKRLDPSKDGRLPVVIEALHYMNKFKSDLPLIGDLVGPLSLATSLIDVDLILKAMIKDRESLNDFLEFLLFSTEEFVRAMVDSGVDVFFITEPFISTSNMISPDDVNEFSVKYLNKLTDIIHNENKEVIVHSCADLELLNIIAPKLNCNGLSVDIVGPTGKSKQSGKALMGGADMHKLNDDFGVINHKAWTEARRLIDEGVDILSPNCAITNEVSLATLNSFVMAIHG